MKNPNPTHKESILNVVYKSSGNCNVYLEELVHIYESEKNLKQTLPLMIENATTPEIVKALTTHLKFTQDHLQRLEELFDSINVPLVNNLKSNI